MRRVVFVAVSLSALITIAPAATGSPAEVSAYSRVAAERPRARNGRIAFVTTQTVAPKGLVSIRPDGTKPVLVPTSPSDARSLVLSPDGTHIAYDLGQESTVYVTRADGTGRRKVAEGSDPSWSPDGTQLVVVGRDRMLRIVSVAGGPSHDLGVGGSHPAWSPTAEWVAFVSVGEDQIEAIRPDGTGRRTVADNAYASPLLWSPSGRWLAITSRDGSDAHLDVIRVDGSGRRRLGIGIFGHDTDPVWAPRADLLALRSEGEAVLRIQPPDGEPLATADAYGAVAWSPDGRFLAVGSGNLELTLVDVAAGSRRRLGRGGSPQWSPDGKRVAFVRGADLWTVPAAGGSPRRIAGGVAGPPVWTRTGRIVYARSRLWRGVIVSVTPTGRDRRLLRAARAHFDDRTDFAEVTWSPDGRHISYVADVEGSQRLEVISARGGRPRLLATRAGGATWSPDATRIAYSRGGIHVRRLAGGTAQRLTRGPDGTAAWSPDGRHIGFVRVRFDAGALHLVQVEGGRVRRLVPDGVASFSWSPDSRRITYDDNRGAAPAIRVIGVDGRGSRRIAIGDGDPESGEVVWDPRWSPDGTRIAYSSEQFLCGSKCSQYSLVVISSSGRPMKLLNHLEDASWSPDGRRLLGVGHGDDSYALVSLDGATARKHVVAQSVTSASWQPLPSAKR